MSSSDEIERIAEIASAQKAIAQIAADEEARSKTEALRQKWEYLFVTFQWVDGLWKVADIVGQTRLQTSEIEYNAFRYLGENGWELVHYSVQPNKAALDTIFKRPKI